jgi:hypothetical protein
MTGDEIKSLLEEVFFEDEYEISDVDYVKYEQKLKRIFVKCYSEKLNKHMTMLVVDNLIIGTTIVEDVWQITWTLPNQNYYMKIPGTSTKRNPKDVGDSKSFLMLSKQKLKDVILINEMNRRLMEDMRRMDKEPTEIVRDFKLNNIL